MSITRSDDYIISLIKELLKQPNETEWLEFKHNNDDKEMIGEYISALSNSAALNSKIKQYHLLIYGIKSFLLREFDLVLMWKTQLWFREL